MANLRLNYLDNLKGFLIICVILGHAIQFSNPSFDNVPLFRFIYSFHMPLFMWVSGFVNYRTETNLSVLKRRAIQLALPFAAWVTFHCMVTMNLYFWVDVVYNPTISVWFIWDLFLIICFTTIINYWCEKNHNSSLLITSIAFVVMQIGIKACHTEFLGISHTLDMGLFYIMGYYMKKYEVFNKYVSVKFGGAIFVLFLLGCLFWQRKQPPTFYPEGGKIVMLLYKMLIAALACISIPVVFKTFLNKNTKFFTYLGQQTLGIYVIHMSLIFYFIKYYDKYCHIDNEYFEYISLTIVTLVITQIINITLQKYKLTRLIFLGKK